MHELTDDDYLRGGDVVLLEGKYLNATFLTPNFSDLHTVHAFKDKPIVVWKLLIILGKRVILILL